MCALGGGGDFCAFLWVLLVRMCVRLGRGEGENGSGFCVFFCAFLLIFVCVCSFLFMCVRWGAGEAVLCFCEFLCVCA